METKTDFFTKLAPLLTGGLNLTLTLKRVGDQITVATRPQRPDVKDKNDVLSKIQPLVITETAEALDTGYIETITQAAEPVNSIADGLKEFNKGVEAAKKAAESKPKKAPSKSSPSKPKAKAKSSPKLSPEEKQAKLQKEADTRKASEIKGLEAKVTAATGYLEANKFTLAEQAIAGGLKLWKAKKYTLGAGDTDYGQTLADLSERAKKLRADKERGENMKRAAKPMSDARKLFTSLNMPQAAVALKAVYKLVPDHEEALALTKEVVEKFGQTVYDQLMAK
jgi:PRTRC genetic system protein E